MEDHVIIRRDYTGEYRWERRTADFRLLATSADGYDSIEECEALAESCNAKPYALDLDESTED